MFRDKPVIVKKLPPCGIFYLKSSHSEKFSMEMGVWSFRKICWIEAGTGFLEYQDSRIPIRQGDIITVAPDTVHRFIDNRGTPCTLAIACYDEKNLPDLYKKIHNDFLRIFKRPLSINDPWRRNSLYEHFRKILIEQSRKLPGYEEMITAGLIELTVFLIRTAREDNSESTTKEKLIQGLSDYLKKNFSNDISVESLASICKVSSRSLSRHFKEITGKTIVQYITELRINYACERLKETGQISFSAFDAGFNDISFFYRVFKKHTGLTPKEFLNRN